jgi:predicted RNA polymerase sigma factor
MVRGSLAGLALLATLGEDDRVSDHHLMLAVRGHRSDMAGKAEVASDAYRVAARRTASLPEKRYLERRACQVRQRSG